MKKIRYGVMGLGHIAQVAVLPAFSKAKRNSELAAILTGDPRKAKVLAKKYKVPLVYDYEGFDELLESKAIDALYIALPNQLHREYAERALRAGLHVLCEKPLALSVMDCRSILGVAEEEGRKLMTAYRLHFEAANLKAMELCQSGKLGDLKYFSSDFSFQVKDPDNIRLRQETGGGPVWDIGIYCINAARSLFRAQPEEVYAYAAEGDDKRFREVEEGVSVVMRFAGGRLATFNCSFGADSVSTYQIVGTKGTVRVENAYEYAAARELVFYQDMKKKKFSFKKSDQFAPELLYFSDCILKNKQPEPSALEGLADVAVIEAIYSSLATGRVAAVYDPGKRTHPKESMRSFVRPHAKPEMVHSTGPTN